MSGHFDDPAHWLKLAQESRATAEFLAHPHKRTLLLIAQRYEMMAERARGQAEQEGSAKSA